MIQDENQPGCGCFLLMLIVLPVMLILVLALLGPAIGNVFSNITTAL
jgi:hypothetical protein